MQASLCNAGMTTIVQNVTKSVTNLMGNPGESRATVTNSVTKLRGIQGNEINTFGELRGTEGN